MQGSKPKIFIVRHTLGILCHIFVTLFAMAAPIVFLGLKYSGLGRSNNYNSSLVKGHGCDCYLGRFGKFRHTETIIPISSCEVSLKPLTAHVLTVFLPSIALKCIISVSYKYRHFWLLGKLGKLRHIVYFSIR